MIIFYSSENVGGFSRFFIIKQNIKRFVVFVV